MKVKCIKNYLTDEQKQMISMPMSQHPVYRIKPEAEYTVLGLTFMINNPYQNGISVEIKDDTDYLTFPPLCLFKIVDPRPSSYWKADALKDDFSLWPEEFYMDYFHDQLSNGVPEYVEAFNRAVARLENEFDYALPGDENVSANRFLFEVKQLIDCVKLNKWDYQRFSDVMADLIAKIKPEESPLYTRVLDAWAVIFNQSLDTPSDHISDEHIKVLEGILTKQPLK